MTIRDNRDLSGLYNFHRKAFTGIRISIPLERPILGYTGSPLELVTDWQGIGSIGTTKGRIRTIVPEVATGNVTIGAFNFQVIPAGIRSGPRQGDIIRMARIVRKIVLIKGKGLCSCSNFLNRSLVELSLYRRITFDRYLCRTHR